jgi:outer membrane lipoprotein-sorting protein
MKKHIFLLMMLCMLVLFVTGCNNNNAELPTFEELAKINSYEEIFKTHSNVFVQTVQKSDIKEEDVTEEILFFPGNGKVDYHLRKKLNSEDHYYEKASRYGNCWYYSLNEEMFAVLELGEKFILDYTINDLYTCIPVGKPYIEDNMIVYHTYLIMKGFEEGTSKRDDYTYYFNLETKLLEKITGVQYNANHEVISTYENIFTYDVKEYFSPTLYDTITKDENNIKLEIVFDYNTNEQKSYEIITTHKANNLVYFNDSTYSLYTEPEFINQVLTLEEYTDVKNLKLYAKLNEYSE